VVNVLPEDGSAGDEDVTYVARALEALCASGRATDLCGDTGGWCRACADDAACPEGWSCRADPLDVGRTWCAQPCSADPDLWFGYADDDASDGAAKARVYEQSATKARTICLRRCPLAQQRLCARQAVDIAGHIPHIGDEQHRALHGIHVGADGKIAEDQRRSHNEPRAPKPAPPWPAHRWTSALSSRHSSSRFIRSML
jgi:hypothetical protein